MKITKIVKQLVMLSPRFAKGEEQTAEFIRSFLEENKVPFVDQEFTTTVPYPKKVELTIDGKRIDAKNTGMESGIFNSKDAIISSLFWGDNDFYYPQNINFNPHAGKSVSMAMYFKHPALAIKRSDVAKVLKAKTIKGETIVEPYTFTGHNFLVGNTKNPTTVVFTHYDCWETGAIDNASGTAILMQSVVKNPKLLDSTLFVIGGNEEISYDEPVYWGRGYRAFEEKYSNLLDSAKKIICIDSVGFAKHIWYTDPEFVVLGLPLKNFETYASKTKMLMGPFETLLEVYHSADDLPKLVSEERLLEAKHMLIKELSY